MHESAHLDSQSLYRYFRLLPYDRGYEKVENEFHMDAFSGTCDRSDSLLANYMRSVSGMVGDYLQNLPLIYSLSCLFSLLEKIAGFVFFSSSLVSLSCS